MLDEMRYLEQFILWQIWCQAMYRLCYFKTSTFQVVRAPCLATQTSNIPIYSIAVGLISITDEA